MRHSWEGNLTLKTSRPGATVRCSQLPGERFKEFWDRMLKLQALHFIPKVGERYLVRANVLAPHGFDPRFKWGLLLSKWPDNTPQKNSILKLNGNIDLEPYFPLTCFDFVA